ncbi:MAG: adenine deaminase [Deltaproteobacteria bacterium]|nr:adenine deaminase [Deltaproteobacteria bacterium]
MDSSSERLKHLIEVAQGLAPADLVIRGGLVVDVHLNRLIEGSVVGLCGDRIAYLGPEEANLFGPQTRLEDLGGAFLLPGFIDAHTHLDGLFQCASFVERALPFGNTTSITETAMIAAALGSEGVDLFCQDAAGLPMRIFFLSPSLTPPFPELETSAGFDDEAFDRFIARPDVLGLGETYWPLALDGDRRPLYRFGRAQALGKSIEGHGAGLRGRRLGAYRAAGVESCHEATNGQEAKERLRLGMAMMIREGYIRREMEAVLPALGEAELDSGLVMLVTDTADPAELLTGGGMNLLLKKAVSLGLDPLRAIRLITLNPARYFNLRLLGAVVPGGLADLVAVGDLESFECLKVWAGGRLAAKNGRLVRDLDRFIYPDWTRESFKIKEVSAQTFTLPVSGRRAKVRVVAVDSETITREEIVEMDVSEGQIAPAPNRDILKAAHFDRQGLNAPALGLIRGLGLKSGAVAVSYIWDTNNLLVLGAEESEMARAANRVLEMGGGLAVAAQGRIEAEFALPIGGIIAEGDLAAGVGRMEEVEEALRRLGSTLARPLLTLQTLVFTGLPFLRLTDKGLLDVRQGRLVEVVIT